MRSKVPKGQRSLGLTQEVPARLTSEATQQLAQALAQLLLEAARSDNSNHPARAGKGGDHER
jgi:hypothetical protein